jgi:predicted kinase
MMQRLAEVLAEFHLHAEPIAAVERARHRAEVAREWHDNLEELRPFAGRLIDVESLNVLEDFGADFIGRHGDLLQRRAGQGWVRDVHGDLHCEHVCFAPEGIQIYDCVEFSAKLRRCDLASEIAFLLMDLAVRGAGSLRAPFLDRYLELIKDAELPVLLPFYECYRALVRAKVEALRPAGASARAPRYFQYAMDLTLQAVKPFLILVTGLTGSGKSTLSRELARRLRMPVINSDVVRKELAGESARKMVPFAADIYTPAMTEKTYDRMADLAAEQVLTGAGAIVDATFSTKANRKKFLKLAEQLNLPLVVIHCFTTEQTTRTRLAQRLADGTDISDGRWEIYVRQKETYEPLEEIPPAWGLELDTEGNIDELAGESLEFLRARIKRWRNGR